MKNKTQLSIKIKLLFYVVFIAILTQSCISMVRHKDMKLISKRDVPTILSLKASKIMKDEFLEQAEKLVNGHLCKQNESPYGYYVIKYNTMKEEGMSTSGVVSLTYSIILGGGLLFLFGTPANSIDFWLEANLYIFDSNGKLVKKYSDGDYFEQVAGIYYGHDPTKKAAKVYSKIYDRIFKHALQDTDYINATLQKSGVITKENNATVEYNIKTFLDAE